MSKNINLYCSENIVGDIETEIPDLNVTPIDSSLCVEFFTDEDFTAIDKAVADVNIANESKLVSVGDLVREQTERKRFIGNVEYYKWMKEFGDRAVKLEGIPTETCDVLPASIIICSECGKACYIRPAYEITTILVMDMCGRCCWCNGAAAQMFQVYGEG